MLPRQHKEINKGEISYCRTDTKGALLYGYSPYVRSARSRSPDAKMSGLFCVTAFRTRVCIPRAALRLSS